MEDSIEELNSKKEVKCDKKLETRKKETNKLIKIL